MSGQPTVVYHAANSQQAHLLKGLLEERGIAAWVVNDSIQIAGGELPLGWTAAARVVVGEDDALEARQFAESFDERTAHEPTPDEASEPKPAEWQDWPLCPKCGEKRAIRCPICGVNGTQFELADIQETESGPRPLFMCDACDDHFLPEFFRRCHHCGYDYGDGYEVESAAQPSDSSPRLWLLVAALLVATALVIGYFALVLR